MKKYRLTNNILVGTNVLLLIGGIFGKEFLILGLLFALLTGFIQVIIGIIILVDYSSKSIKNYLIGVILYFGIFFTIQQFTTFHSGFYDVLINIFYFLIPTILSIYLTLIINLIDSKTFLSANWKDLVMINYEVEKEVLLPYLPKSVELDDYNGKYYVSLVAFMFLNTKLLGFKIPFYTNFEEVNLRFYVKRIEGNEVKRGVVFIKEFVPKYILAKVANIFYKEPYEKVEMSHNISVNDSKRTLDYSWNTQNWNSIEVETELVTQPLLENSFEEFIAEHYWGYTKISDNKTAEYEVQHPKWNYFNVINHKSNVDFTACYGNNFNFLNHQNPFSIFMAEGSDISVLNGQKI